MKSQMKIHPAEAALPATAVPRTLRELGLDGGLAAGFELAFRLMGAVDGGRVVGYTLTTSDGVVLPHGYLFGVPLGSLNQSR